MHSRWDSHEVVAIIAERHLTEKDREGIPEILGADASVAAVSTWIHDVRPSRSETARWHYIDIPLNASAIVPARDGTNGDGVTAAMVRFVAVLREKSSTPEAKHEP